MIAGLYRPGDSPLHRHGAGVKLLALVALGTLLFALDRTWLAAAALMTTLAAYRFAGFSPATAGAQIRPAAWMLVILFLAQIWLADWATALLLVLRFATLILAASLVTAHDPHRRSRRDRRANPFAPGTLGRRHGPGSASPSRWPSASSPRLPGSSRKSAKHRRHEARTATSSPLPFRSRFDSSSWPIPSRKRSTPGPETPGRQPVPIRDV